MYELVYILQGYEAICVLMEINVFSCINYKNLCAKSSRSSNSMYVVCLYTDTPPGVHRIRLSSQGFAGAAKIGSLGAATLIDCSFVGNTAAFGERPIQTCKDDETGTSNTVYDFCVDSSKLNPKP